MDGGRINDLREWQLLKEKRPMLRKEFGKTTVVRFLAQSKASLSILSNLFER